MAGGQSSPHSPLCGIALAPDGTLRTEDCAGYFGGVRARSSLCHRTPRYRSQSWRVSGNPLNHLTSDPRPPIEMPYPALHLRLTSLSQLCRREAKLHMQFQASARTPSCGPKFNQRAAETQGNHLLPNVSKRISNHAHDNVCGITTDKADSRPMGAGAYAITPHDPSQGSIPRRFLHDRASQLADCRKTDAERGNVAILARATKTRTQLSASRRVPFQRAAKTQPAPASEHRHDARHPESKSTTALPPRRSRP